MSTGHTWGSWSPRNAQVVYPNTRVCQMFPASIFQLRAVKWKTGIRRCETAVKHVHEAALENPELSLLKD